MRVRLDGGNEGKFDSFTALLCKEFFKKKNVKEKPFENFRRRNNRVVEKLKSGKVDGAYFSLSLHTHSQKKK